MKIAILYSGNMRTYGACAHNHAEVFGQADVYFSVWDEWGYSDKINDKWHSLLPDRESGKVTESRIRELTPSKFLIQKIEIEQYSSFIRPFDLQKDNHLWFQYHRLWKSFNLLRDVYEYDYIVRIRPDITIDSCAFHPRAITLNTNYWYEKPLNGENVNEMIFTVPSDLAVKAFSVINNLKSINNRLNIHYVYGESIMFQHFKMEGLMDNANIYNFNYRVWR